MPMADPRVEQLADVLVSHSTHVKEGDLVVIESSPVAAPLVRELYRRILRAGGQPEPRLALPGTAEALVASGTEEQLDWVSPRAKEDAELADVRIAIIGDENTRSLSGAAPERLARIARAREPLRRRMIERKSAGEFTWTVTSYPTQAAAQEARMSLSRFEDQLFGAALLHAADPVTAWRELGDRMRRLVDWLGGVRELRVVADGTDLRVGVEGMHWIVCDGVHNLPDGEVFTAPVEASVEGTIRFTYPAVFQRRAVADVKLRFREGVVVEALAAQGQSFLEEMLGLDAGARRPGEFAFGLNDAVSGFTGETLLDEKIGGTVHLALGEAYPESGGTNTSALHWDMVCDLRRGGEVFADGELVYRDGRFLGDRF
jgi:aminopeptidase